MEKVDNLMLYELSTFPNDKWRETILNTSRFAHKSRNIIFMTRHLAHFRNVSFPKRDTLVKRVPSNRGSSSGTK